MRILFDQGAPAPLRSKLRGHIVETAYERGWSALDNGDLLTAAEADLFDVLLTTDRNLLHQQDFSYRGIADGGSSPSGSGLAGHHQKDSPTAGSLW